MPRLPHPNTAIHLIPWLQISPGIPELVQLLKGQGKEVFLVSGGFRAVIHPIAEVGLAPGALWQCSQPPASIQTLSCWSFLPGTDAGHPCQSRLRQHHPVQCEAASCTRAAAICPPCHAVAWLPRCLPL